MIAKVIADAISASSSAIVAAVSSRSRETAEVFAASYKPARAFGSWRELLAWDGVDAAYVATPTHVREEICIAAAGRKKHILGEKPFVNLSSLKRITDACRTNDVVFMDATQFVHHPRSKELKRDLQSTIGVPQAVRVLFFFPFMDRSNIRFDIKQEPTGAIGDMAWYSARAAVEFLPPSDGLAALQSVIQRDEETNAVIRGAGIALFDNGTTLTWDVGYNAGACLMDLDIIGTLGVVQLDDFVLDWQKGFAFDNAAHEVGYRLRQGMAAPHEVPYIKTPSEKSQQTVMIEDFAALIEVPEPGSVEASMQTSERTQALLDAIWKKASS